MKAGAYVRVSTDSQECLSQRHDIEKWAVAHPAYEVVWYEDDGISGTTLKRPGFQRMLADIEAGKIQAVVCFRLDRISRSAPTALQILLGWMQRDVEFFATSQPIFQLGKDNPLRLTVTALFAELADLERQAISSRTKAALAAKKAQGMKLGKPPKLTREQRAQARELAMAGKTTREIARVFGVSHTTISRALLKEATA